VGKGKKVGEETSKTLLKRMTAGSPSTVTVVIPFANNDVPRYLKKLDEFENRPSKRLIVVK
jgi:hypothetical protein